MTIAIGTANLGKEFNENFFKVFVYAIENGITIHSSLEYENVSQYFLEAKKIILRSPKTILKITVSKNPIKNKKKISEQINNNMKRFGIETIENIKLCNNPLKIFPFDYMLKKTLDELRRKKIVKKIFLEIFPSYEKNIKKYLNDSFYDGFLFEFNLLRRSISDEFLYEILNSQKKIIIYSPFLSGKINDSNNSYKNLFKEFSNNPQFKDNFHLTYGMINFLKNNLDFVIFGTQNIERLNNLKRCFDLDLIKINSDEFKLIVNNQNTINKY